MILTAALALGCSRALSVPPEEFTIDFSARKPISDYVYGANFPEWSKMAVPFTLSRLGGNRMTAYNWETNASNAGNDWHHQNDGYMGASDEPGWTLRTFMEAAQSHGAAAIITIPTAGYVSADKKGDGDVANTPDYIHTRFFRSYATKPGMVFNYPPNTKDSAVYQDECVHWLESIKSPKTPVWYMLDNEPDIWFETHKRIVPQKVSYAGIIENNVDFASAIKAVAPRALVFGPANYGWEGFRRFQDAPDANGRDFLDVYLSAMQEAEVKHSKRLLDVLDIHWYPEAKGGGLRITTNDDKPGTAEARIQTSRSLWDPTYVEDSWITQSLGGKPIALLPGVLSQIGKHYPGTKLSISEYNYGGAKVISGAIAQADVLGIFGRYGVFAACNWGIGPADTAQLAGFKAFLNFDGKGAKFGDVSLGVTGETASQNSVFAAVDSKNPRHLTIVAINKTAREMPMTFHLARFSGVQARAFVIASDSLAEPKPAEAKLNADTLRFTAPALSVTTIEVR